MERGNAEHAARAASRVPDGLRPLFELDGCPYNPVDRNGTGACHQNCRLKSRVRRNVRTER